MARKKKELPLLEKVTITDVAAEGKALARVNDMVVFVPYVVPGDVVDLQVKRKKHSYAEAVAVKFHEYSPLRSEPFCKHFGVCGGCKWQCLKYEEQIRYKQKQVTDNLVRIGKIELPEISPILGSEQTERYRNKLEFTFSNKRWLTQEEINSELKIENTSLEFRSEGVTGVQTIPQLRESKDCLQAMPSIAVSTLLNVTTDDSANEHPADGLSSALLSEAKTPELLNSPKFNRNAVGFHIPGAFDKVLAIDECHLMDDICNRIRNGVRDYAYEQGLTFFDLRSQEGMLRNMMIRVADGDACQEYRSIGVTGVQTIPQLSESKDCLQALPSTAVSTKLNVTTDDCANENSANGPSALPSEAKTPELLNSKKLTGLMVVMQFKIVAPEEEAQMLQLLQFMADTWPEITSLIYVINNKCNDTIGDLPIHVFKGDDHIIEEMEGLKFKVGPKSFYQTNSRQAYNLYKVTREFAGLTGDELVYDLYTGTGTIANFVSRKARQVIGIEYVPEAIEDAKVNSAINGIDNTLFFAGDMKDILNQEFINQYGRPDVIITDPPRAGMHTDVIDTILFAEPKRIVYVSCNPATQARDLSLLDVKYKVLKVQPVDMFPHTHHVENVVLLELKD